MRRRALGLGGLLGALLFTFAGPAFGASRNVELVDNLPEAKNATAINFLHYRERGRRDARDRPLRPEVVLAGATQAIRCCSTR